MFSDLITFRLDTSIYEFSFNMINKLIKSNKPKFDRIESIDCDNCGLSKLWSVLPENLYELKCGYNYLSALPNLPYNLTSYYSFDLECAYNMIIELPDLPQDLFVIDCSTNRLTRLQDIPGGNIEVVICNVNLIKYIQPHNIDVYYEVWKYCHDNLEFDCDTDYATFFMKCGFDV